MTYLGSRLKYLRKLENITQQQLATALGIAKSTVSMYENGQREPDFETLEAISDYFNVDMSTFFPQSEKTPVPISEDRQNRNIIKIAGRDGSFVERELTDDQIALLKTMLDQLKPIDSENI